MPFVKPKVRTYNVLLVGETKSKTCDFLSKVRKGCLSNDRMCTSGEVSVRTVCRSGWEARIMFWPCWPARHEPTILPNFFHGSDVVLFLCEGKNDLVEKLHLQSEQHSPLAEKIIVLAVGEDDSWLHRNHCQAQKVKLFRENQILPLLKEIEEILLKDDTALYNSLSLELAKINLDSDKRNLANKTLCFERNSIG